MQGLHDLVLALFVESSSTMGRRLEGCLSPSSPSERMYPRRPSRESTLDHSKPAGKGAAHISPSIGCSHIARRCRCTMTIDAAHGHGHLHGHDLCRQGERTQPLCGRKREWAAHTHRARAPREATANAEPAVVVTDLGCLSLTRATGRGLHVPETNANVAVSPGPVCESAYRVCAGA